jgi:hypothetical protein
MRSVDRSRREEMREPNIKTGSPVAAATGLSQAEAIPALAA